MKSKVIKSKFPEINQEKYQNLPRILFQNKNVQEKKNKTKIIEINK